MSQSEHTTKIQRSVAECRTRHLTRGAAKRSLSEQAQILRGQGITVRVKDLQEELRRQYSLRETRDARRPAEYETDTHTRIMALLCSICARQIRVRRLDVPTGYGGQALVVRHVSPGRRLWLCYYGAWFEYSRSFGSRFLEAGYLCGRDDGQYFAVRVPSTCRTVDEALEWLTPGAVKKAQAEGRWVERQGDVWLVELKAGRDNVTALPRSHHYDRETRIMAHPQHGSVAVPAHVRAVRTYNQIQIATGGSRRAAD